MSTPINLEGVIGCSVSDWIGQPAWLTTVRAVLLVAAFACLAVFVIEGRRRRAAEADCGEILGEAP